MNWITFTCTRNGVRVYHTPDKHIAKEFTKKFGGQCRYDRQVHEYQITI